MFETETTFLFISTRCLLTVLCCVVLLYMAQSTPSSGLVLSTSIHHWLTAQRLSVLMSVLQYVTR